MLAKRVVSLTFAAVFALLLAVIAASFLSSDPVLEKSAEVAAYLVFPLTVLVLMWVIALRRSGRRP